MFQNNFSQIDFLNIPEVRRWAHLEKSLKTPLVIEDLEEKNFRIRNTYIIFLSIFT